MFSPGTYPTPVRRHGRHLVGWSNTLCSRCEQRFAPYQNRTLFTPPRQGPCAARTQLQAYRIAAKSGILASGQELTCEEVPDAERKLRRHLRANLVLDYTPRCCYLSFSLAHEGACSRGTPEYGARRGVPRQRYATAAPGGTGPRPPGTTTRTRGARCDRSGARRSASLGELPVREARDRSLKSPR